MPLLARICSVRVHTFDRRLLRQRTTQHRSKLHRFCLEVVFFTIKELRACLFGILFFALVLLTPRSGLLGLPRYDLLFIGAILIQIWLIWHKLETLEELKAISLFHAVGFCLELFKTSQSIQAWTYPDVAYTKILGVPLFAGFMYAAVGSYILQAWRLLELRIIQHPPYWMAQLMALLIYLNFFTHHFIGDYRWYIAACIVGLYARTIVVFKPLEREYKMPLVVAFILIGFFIWLAENISTFLHIWHYPHQLTAWSLVHISKWTSWSLLMTFTIVTQLQHIKTHIHISPSKED